MNNLEIFMTGFMLCIMGAIVASTFLGADKDFEAEERRDWWEGDD
jgi:hypothetical protein